MSYAPLETFYAGLEALLGPPRLIEGSLRRSMHAEHCEAPDSTEVFCSANGLSTYSSLEWEFVVEPSSNKEYPERGRHGGSRGRCASRVDRLQGSHARAAVQVPSATGRSQRAPRTGQARRDDRGRGDLGAHVLQDRCMSNGVLRSFSGVPFLKHKCAQLTRGNQYPTTIHAINSAVVKLSKLTVACRVYRGFAGARLPDSFFVPDKFNTRGGVELGFSSTTAERAQAEHYAAAGSASTLMVAQMGMVDRGAELSWLSMYEHEKEILFPPLTGVEVLESRVQGSTLLVMSHLAVNLTSPTLEQVVSKRRKLVIDLADNSVHELEREVRRDEWTELSTALGLPSPARCSARRDGGRRAAPLDAPAHAAGGVALQHRQLPGRGNRRGCRGQGRALADGFGLPRAVLGTGRVLHRGTAARAGEHVVDRPWLWIHLGVG